MEQLLQTVEERLRKSKGLWLFLDYDGTLADFAPTPETINPDPEIADLLDRLAKTPGIRVAVISGRRLSHVQDLLPVPNVLLAGTYGVELFLPDEGELHHIEYNSVRPALEVLKPRWEALIAGRPGFFLEDKGWALALHAKFAGEADAQRVLTQAKRQALELDFIENFRILGGHKFLEVGPKPAHKGQTVEYLLEHFPWQGALLVSIGDDDKDVGAFAVIQDHGGIAVVVAGPDRPSIADFRLESPLAVRQFLEALLRLQVFQV